MSYILSCRRIPNTYIANISRVCSNPADALKFPTKQKALDWWGIYRSSFPEFYDVFEHPIKETKTMTYRLKTAAYVEAIQFNKETTIQKLADFFSLHGVSIYKCSEQQLKLISDSQILYVNHSNWIVKSKDTGRLSIIEDSTFRAQYESC